MNSLETYMEFDFISLFDSQTKQQLKKISSQVATTLYNEFYIYIWFICIYSVFLLVLTITNLGLLIHLYTLFYKINANINIISTNANTNARELYHFVSTISSTNASSTPSTIHKYHKD